MATAHAATINSGDFRYSDEKVAEFVRRIKAATPEIRANAAEGEASRSPACPMSATKSLTSGFLA